MPFNTYKIGDFKAIYLHKSGYNFRGSITETEENIINIKKLKNELLDSGIDLEKKMLYRCSVEHGNNVTLLDYITNREMEHFKIGGVNIYRPFKDSDAIITSDINATLLLSTADCLPIIIVDKKQNVFGLIHAGWKGIIKDVVINTLDKMITIYGSKKEDIFIQIGPHIGFSDFNINDSKIKREFIEYLLEAKLIKNDKSDVKKYITTSKTFLYNIDLSKIVVDRLISSGIPKENISIDKESTYSFKDKDGDYKYHSYRRDYKKSGRNPMILFYEK